jgi:predicted small integral membrane protein
VKLTTVLLLLTIVNLLCLVTIWNANHQMTVDDAAWKSAMIARYGEMLRLSQQQTEGALRVAKTREDQLYTCIDKLKGGK